MNRHHQRRARAGLKKRKTWILSNGMKVKRDTKVDFRQSKCIFLSLSLPSLGPNRFNTDANSRSIEIHQNFSGNNRDIDIKWNAMNISTLFKKGATNQWPHISPSILMWIFRLCQNRNKTEINSLERTSAIQSHDEGHSHE